MFKKIVSAILKLKIEEQRVFDHAWRKITGLPTLRRSHITPDLFLGGQYKLSKLATLKKLGVTGIVNMRMYSIHGIAAIQGFNYLHLPTIDQTAPTISDLHKGVKFIEKEIENKGKVYIHCRHGEGRGPSMAMAYLIYTGLTYDDAFNLVKKVRTFIRPTKVQVEQLKKFETLVSKKIIKE